MLMQATQLRVGNIIEHEGQLWRVMEATHRTPGNKRGFMQAKLRNLKSGTQTEYKFASEDRVERVSLEQHIAEYLYESGGRYTFMNTENYEQIEISAEDLGDSASWLAPGLKLQVQFYEGRPIGVELPKTVKAKILETQPMMRGATASASYKPATLENGVVVLVPPFVTEGEEIIVDPSDNRYIERAR
jgi:elongation factor P